MVQTTNGRKLIHHSGGIEGFLTELDYYPNDKLTVIVMENITGAKAPNEIARKLAALVHGDSDKAANQ